MTKKANITIKGQTLTGKEALSCNICPESKKPYLLIKGKDFKIRIDEPKERDFVIDFFLGRIKEPVKRAQLQHFKITGPPDKLPLPKELSEIEGNIFSLKRMFEKKLQSLAEPERKSLQGEFNFNFKEGTELYKYEYKTPQGKAKAIIAKELLNEGLPSLSLMKKAFLISIALGYEQGTRENITFTLGKKLKWLGYTKEDLKKYPDIYSKLSNTEKALFGTAFVYENKKKGKDYVFVGIHPYTHLEIKGKGKGAKYTAGINSRLTRGINFKYEDRKELHKPVNPPFKNIPIALITGKKLNIYEKNIRTKALEHTGQGFLKIYGANLLNWAGLPESMQRAKKTREKTFELCKEVLRKQGFTKLRTDHKGNKKDFRKWLLTFINPDKAGKLEDEPSKYEERDVF
jgi:hypothetical protein